ncbi:MAG TPA: adenylate/guanylate cyclase domain-containing protein, partial [bacterium]|nr:adenylate/guanylate cyclase domain-containing protein [bacterium]
ARAVGFDILFTEKASNPDEDRMLAQSISESRNLFLAAYFRKIEEKPGRLPAGEDPVFPLAQFRKEPGNLAIINAPPDPDGVTRGMPLFVESGGKSYPTLGMALACAYLDIKPETIQILGNRLEITDRSGRKLMLPVDRRGRLRINFSGGLGTFQGCPWETLLTSHIQSQSGRKPDFPLETLKGKIVLIGSAVSGGGDLRPTPVDPVFPMFALHAGVLQDILSGSFLVRPGAPARLLILILLGLLAGLATDQVRLGRRALMLTAILAGYLAVAWGLFRSDLWLDLAAPILAVFLTFAAETNRNYFAERREKTFLRQTFTRYLAPEIVSQLLTARASLNLGGDRRRVTVLFADLRGFTRLSEGRPPEEVVRLLNEFLGLVTEAVFRNRGTLDKFIGDCAMAVFGAPLDLDEPELAAARTALEIQAGLAELASRWQTELGIGVGVGIGINTGEAVVGNIGSRRRLDYTAIGDAVNVAQRLESIAGPGVILLSEATFQALAGKIRAEAQEPVQVKNRVQPVIPYRLIAVE